MQIPSIFVIKCQGETLPLDTITLSEISLIHDEIGTRLRSLVEANALAAINPRTFEQSRTHLDRLLATFEEWQQTLELTDNAKAFILQPYTDAAHVAFVFVSPISHICHAD